MRGVFSKTRNIFESSSQCSLSVSRILVEVWSMMRDVLCTADGLRLPAVQCERCVTACCCCCGCCLRCRDALSLLHSPEPPERRPAKTPHSSAATAVARIFPVGGYHPLPSVSVSSSSLFFPSQNLIQRCGESRTQMHSDAF